MMVGRLLSYWEGNFSGAMLNLGRVKTKVLSYPIISFFISVTKVATATGVDKPKLKYIICTHPKGNWLVVSTHLKNMSQNGFIFPNFRGEHQKIFELPPSRYLHPKGKQFNPQLLWWPFRKAFRCKRMTSSTPPACELNRQGQQNLEEYLGLNRNQGVIKPPKRQEMTWKTMKKLWNLVNPCERNPDSTTWGKGSSSHYFYRVLGSSQVVM